MKEKESDRAIEKLSAARQCIAEAAKIAAIEPKRGAAMLKQGAAMAEAARNIAKRIGLGLEAQNEAASLKIDAERSLGVILPEKLRGKGRPPKQNGHDVLFTLEEIGIHPKESQRCQLLASLSDEAVEEYKTQCREDVKEITSSALLSLANRLKKEEKVNERRKAKTEAFSELPSPGGLSKLSDGAGRYRVIYADPPWNYNDRGTHGSAYPHYDTMTLNKLCELPGAKDLPHPEGAFLWLWTTWPMIREKAPHAVIDAWGFRWVGEIVWNKLAFGVGRWFRLQTEVLILAVRGEARLSNNNQRAYLEARRGRHSVKPEEARAIIERLCPGPYVELFARRAAKGWDRWGDEA